MTASDRRVPRRRRHRVRQPQRAAVHARFPRAARPSEGALPARCVVDGEIVVADQHGRGLDFDALLQRIDPAESASAALRPRHRRRTSPSTSWRSTTRSCSSARSSSAANSCPRRSALPDRSTSPRPALTATRRPSGSAASRAPASTASWPSASTIPTSPTSGPCQGQARAHRGVRRRRVPHPQGRQRRRLAAPRAVRRRRPAAARRRGGRVQREVPAPSSWPSSSR